MSPNVVLTYTQQQLLLALAQYDEPVTVYRAIGTTRAGDTALRVQALIDAKLIKLEYSKPYGPKRERHYYRLTARGKLMADTLFDLSVRFERLKDAA